MRTYERKLESLEASVSLLANVVVFLCMAGIGLIVGVIIIGARNPKKITNLFNIPDPLEVDTITSKTADTNLELQGKGTGFVQVDDALQVTDAINVLGTAALEGNVIISPGKFISLTGETSHIQAGSALVPLIEPEFETLSINGAIGLGIYGAVLSTSGGALAMTLGDPFQTSFMKEIVVIPGATTNAATITVDNLGGGTTITMTPPANNIPCSIKLLWNGVQWKTMITMNAVIS